MQQSQIKYRRGNFMYVYNIANTQTKHSLKKMNFMEYTLKWIRQQIR